MSRFTPVPVLVRLDQRSLRGHAKDLCGPGERSDLTGCTPHDDHRSNDPKDVVERSRDVHPAIAPKESSESTRTLRKVQVSSKTDLGKLKEALGKLFEGKSFEESQEAIVDSLGMPDDAKISFRGFEIGENGTVGIRVEVEHPKLEDCQRLFGIDENGKKFISNDGIEIKKRFQGEGLGSKIFEDQVAGASRNGFDHLITHAAGRKGNSLNGYYTWPRLGYDQNIDSSDFKEKDAETVKKIREKFPDAETVLDVMLSPGGREWWKENGVDLLNAKFDLSAESRSMKVLNAYLEERKMRKETKSISPPSKRQPSMRRGKSLSTTEFSPVVGHRDVKSFGPHKRGCLMLRFPASFAKQITDWTMENVPDCWLEPEGRELTPHVTALYGFPVDFSRLDELRSMLLRHGPVQVRLAGELSAFTGGKDGTVLKVTVESEELRELHDSLVDAFGIEEKWPTFEPHLTLAFVRPDVGESCLKLRPPFLDQSVQVDAVEWSPASGERETINLQSPVLFGTKRVETKWGSLESFVKMFDLRKTDQFFLHKSAPTAAPPSPSGYKETVDKNQHKVCTEGGTRVQCHGNEQPAGTPNANATTQQSTETPNPMPKEETAGKDSPDGSIAMEPALDRKEANRKALETMLPQVEEADVAGHEFSPEEQKAEDAWREQVTSWYANPKNGRPTPEQAPLISRFLSGLLKTGAGALAGFVKEALMLPLGILLEGPDFEHNFHQAKRLLDQLNPKEAGNPIHAGAARMIAGLFGDVGVGVLGMLARKWGKSEAKMTEQANLQQEIAKLDDAFAKEQDPAKRDAIREQVIEARAKLRQEHGIDHPAPEFARQAEEQRRKERIEQDPSAQHYESNHSEADANELVQQNHAQEDQREDRIREGQEDALHASPKETSRQAAVRDQEEAQYPAPVDDSPGSVAEPNVIQRASDEEREKLANASRSDMPVMPKLPGDQQSAPRKPTVAEEVAEFRKKQAERIKKKADAIRARHGQATKYDPNKKATPEQQEALKHASRIGKEADLSDHLREGEGVDIEQQPGYDPNVAAQFDAHGTGALLGDRGLENLLVRGVDPSREFYTSKLSESGNTSGQGVTLRGSSPFIVVGHPGKTIKEGGIGTVIVNGHHSGAVGELKRAFPNVNFVAAKDANRFLKQQASKTGTKSMSWLTSGAGAELVAPPAQGPKIRQLRRKYLKKDLAGFVKSAGDECKQGERADLTGCTPKVPSIPGTDNDPSKPAVDESKPHLRGNKENPAKFVVIPGPDGKEEWHAMATVGYVSALGNLTKSSGEDVANDVLVAVDEIAEGWDGENSEQVKKQVHVATDALYAKLDGMIDRWKARFFKNAEVTWGEDANLLDKEAVEDAVVIAADRIFDALMGADSVDDAVDQMDDENWDQDAVVESTEIALAAIRDALDDLDAAFKNAEQQVSDAYDAKHEEIESNVGEVVNELNEDHDGEATEEAIQHAKEHNEEAERDGVQWRVWHDGNEWQYGNQEDLDDEDVDYPGKKGKGFDPVPQVPQVKSLRFKSVSSFFASCERDESGHCLPSGESGMKKAAKIARFVTKLPVQVIKKARGVAKAAVNKVEQRYGKNVLRAVKLAVMASLPVPVPGMSVLVAAPIVAFAEIARQSGFGAGKSLNVDEKEIALEVLRELFGGSIPEEVDLDALEDGLQVPHQGTQGIKKLCKQGERSDLTGCTRVDNTAESVERTSETTPQENQRKTRPKKIKERTAHSETTKKAHVLVDASIQRYAEEHNEPAFAKSVGGRSFPNGEPIDVAIEGSDGNLVHGVELKTSVVSANRKIDMNPYAKVRKIVWEQTHQATLHTVVLDDHDVYDPQGDHDVSKRRIFYRRGVGGSKFPIDGMHECKDMEELIMLMNLPEKKLPQKAQRTDAKLRTGKWKPFVSPEGKKGFRNSKTGEEVFAKK
jgi:2'-5' RNA ligase